MDKTKSYKVISIALALILLGITGALIGYVKSDKSRITMETLKAEDKSSQESDLKQDIREKIRQESSNVRETKVDKGLDSKPEEVEERILEEASIKSKYKSITICIDPGHGTTDKSIMERISPWSDEEKPGYAYGTRGLATGIPEKDLVLEVSLKLRDELEKKGFTVVVTREGDHSDLTNIDRAEFGNQANSDLVVRVHANGLDNESVKGMMVLVPSEINLRDGQVVEKSRRAGEFVLEEMLNATGAKSLGIIERDDMTGFNWSKVPVILVEMGFMTNPEEDRLMSTPEYQKKLVDGMVSGILRYVEGEI